MNKPVAGWLVVLLVLLVGSALAGDTTTHYSRFRVTAAGSTPIVGYEGALSSTQLLGRTWDNKPICIPVGDISSLDTCTGTYAGYGILAGTVVGTVIGLAGSGNDSGSGSNRGARCVFIAAGTATAGFLLGSLFRQWRNVRLEPSLRQTTGSMTGVTLSWHF
jgi:hypothetical protein